MKILFSLINQNAFKKLVPFFKFYFIIRQIFIYKTQKSELVTFHCKLF